MNFKLWIKILESEASGASATGGTVATGSGAGSSSNESPSQGTSTQDIAKVPTKLGCGLNCSKDFYKNWYYTKRKKKST
jgi:hypothetical protein